MKNDFSKNTDKTQKSNTNSDDKYITSNDYLKRVQAYLKSFGDYKSFTRNEIYDLMGNATASGLLCDIAATTARLTPDQRKKKEVSENVFAAYIGYHCAYSIYCQQKKWKNENGIDEVATYVWENVHKEMLKRVKQYFNTKEKDDKLKYFRGQTGKRAKRRFSDFMNKQIAENSIEIYDPEAGKELREKFIPLEIQIKETGDELINPEVADYIAEEAAKLYKRDEYRAALIYVLETCQAEELISSDDYDLISLYLGIGDGYDDPMPIADIAEEIGKSYSYVYTHLHDAGEIIKEKMKEFDSRGYTA